MRDGNGALRVLIAVASLALLGGCVGSQAPQTSLPPEGAVRTAIVPSCARAGGGRAECAAAILEAPAQKPTGWSASQLEAAYELPSAARGKGQTVFVVDAYDNPDVDSDFATYRSVMGLPAGKLTRYNQEGQRKNYPEGNVAWGIESDLDVEMVSASCPNCAVALVEAKSNASSDVEAAVKEAVKLGATIVSNSYVVPGAAKNGYDAPGVTYVAAANDNGSGGLEPPAAFDTVVSVGGTRLAKAHNKRGYDETIWADSGGCATGQKKPAWQRHSKYAEKCNGRMANDVSVIASDVAEYDSYSYSGWFPVAGTGVSAPFCAGIFALAGNATKQRGGRTFWVPASHHAHLFELSGERYSAAGGWGSPKGIGAF